MEGIQPSLQKVSLDSVVLQHAFMKKKHRRTVWFSEKVNLCWVGPIPSSILSTSFVPVLPKGGGPSLSRGKPGALNGSPP